MEQGRNPKTETIEEMDHGGIHHLTSDNMVYDCLRDAQQEDELLQAFEIKYVDKTYADMNISQEKNQIYIVRQGSVLNRRLYDSQEFDVEIDVCIMLREYDTVLGQRILKTMYKCIMHHLVNHPAGQYLAVDSFHFEYRETGILECGILTLQAKEVENFEYDYDAHPILVAMGLTTSIMGTNEKHIKYNPHKNEKKKKKHKKQ